MKMQELKNLAALMQDYQLTRVEVSADGNIVMERTAPMAAAPALNAAACEMTKAVPALPADSAPAAQMEADLEKPGRIIKAPMVGVFYTAASPEAEPFVKKGDLVQKGDVLCIIEAMKLMNEINAEEDGEIVEVLARNGQLVEYGQPLFRVAP